MNDVPVRAALQRFRAVRRSMSTQFAALLTGERPISDTVVAVIVAGAAFLVALEGMTEYHAWGDDWAGYALQARALENGTVLEELALNERLLSLSDRQIGPTAYPWGFPSLLWLASEVGFRDIISLKIIGLVAIGVAAACTFLVARLFLGVIPSIAIAAFVVFQREVVAMTNRLMSDLPYLAVSTAAMYVMLLALSHTRGRKRFSAALAVTPVLTVIAFSIRSHGALLAPSFLAALTYLAWNFRDARRPAIVAIGYYAASTLLLVAVYFAVLPDGSLSHASYLRVDLELWLRRLAAIVEAAYAFFPFSILPFTRATLLFTVGALGIAGVLCFYGSWIARPSSLILFTYLMLNLTLMVAYPYGSSRYLYPLLLPVAALAVVGIMAPNQVMQESRGVFAHRSIGRIAAALICFVMPLHALMNSEGPRRYARLGGPFAPATRELVAFVNREIPEEARIAFFKPRALRFLTNRMAIKVTHPQNATRARYFVLDRLADNRWRDQQLPVSFFRSGAFRLIFANASFLVFERLPGTRTEYRPADDAVGSIRDGDLRGD